MKFQPGDVVSIKGSSIEFKVTKVKDEYVTIKMGSNQLMVHPEVLELIHRKGPVVFEWDWFRDRQGFVSPNVHHGETEQFIGKRTRVTVEIIEEGL